MGDWQLTGSSRCVSEERIARKQETIENQNNSYTRRDILSEAFDLISRTCRHIIFAKMEEEWETERRKIGRVMSERNEKSDVRVSCERKRGGRVFICNLSFNNNNSSASFWFYFINSLFLISLIYPFFFLNNHHDVIMFGQISTDELWQCSSHRSPKLRPINKPTVSKSTFSTVQYGHFSVRIQITSCACSTDLKGSRPALKIKLDKNYDLQILDAFLH